MVDESGAGDGFEWGIVEIFGHRRHAGRVREQEQFGAKMLRVDIPIDGDPAKGWVSHFYGGAAIFSYSLSDEATVLKINAPYAPFRLRAPVEENPAPDDEDLDGDLGGFDEPGP